MGTHGLALVPPGAGRRFTASRKVRLGDVLPNGDARLDAVARYLQDVASDDGSDAQIDTELVWLVRKTILQLHRRPRLGDQLESVTWASGSGARWAERRTTISVADEPVVDAASLWVSVDPTTMRAARLPERFWALYREAVDGRVVSPRLTHADVPAVPLADARPWPLRVSDLDVMDHVNNAVTWAVVEDELDRLGLARRVAQAELEYRQPVDRSHELVVTSQVDGDEVRLWLTAGASVLASAVLSLFPPAR